MLKRHAFSFGLQDNPPKGRARFQAKLRRSPKRGLCRIEFSGSINVATRLIFPGLAGTPARLYWRVSCFWVLTSPKISANQRAVPARVGFLPIRVNAGRHLNQGDDP